MGNRLYNGVVIVFWLSTMSWLAVEKVLPTLRVGDPPNYTAILRSAPPEPPICWSIAWNERLSGWATTKMLVRTDGMHELESQVFIADLPLDEMAPGWLGAIVKPVLRQTGRLDMDARSRLEIDPLGRLVGFDSTVRLAHIRDAMQMHGQIDGTRLKLAVQSGDVLFRTERYLPPDALVGDALSPQSRLPGLHVGQRWTTPVYSPFRPPNSPLEILEATVERTEPIMWNGESQVAMVVVYRGEAGAGLSASQDSRGKLWVRRDGQVLKQEVATFNSRLIFTRLGPSQAELLTEALAPYGSGELPEDEAKRLLSEFNN